MLRPNIRLAARDWDYLVPLALGDLQSPDFDLQIDRVGTLPSSIVDDSRYDASEMSFSAYSLARAAGDESIVGVPHFLMRAFRHRCIITASESPLKSIEQLAGKRIGLTGWRDSGSTWTRAILRKAGIDIGDARWFVGRLTEQHAIADRMNGFGRPGCIEPVPDERPMVELLMSGELDAICTPFMPPGFFDPSSGMRQLLADCRAAEVAYFRDVGFVPGIHILGIKPTVVREYPWLPEALSELLDASARMWLQKREKYADTTPWIIDELRQTSVDLPATWNSNGLAANRTMIAAFAGELRAQQLVSRAVTPEVLFPQAA
ncbi:nitrate ABC transporter substrate-binding protein [Burkholderia multivorans]|nr:nitrate ABC transporter substrate-binding protein [Burkholderia multivorans]